MQGLAGEAGLPIWGGVEATIARLGNQWRDQARETGHHFRLDDLDRIASLGLSALRYPVLWESVAPEHPEERDWSWHDQRLLRLRALGVPVIAGLLHHGSGPRYTDLLDPLFPEKLAAHAAAVAARYPWIESFTPVNEPLTTARFSGLYGHWHPHRREQRAFLRALVNQCRGVVLAMRAIRRVTPGARLVQTEDLGRVFSTPLLRYQAEFENERRWLSLDLLCGRVDAAHPLHDLLRRNGIGEAELAFLREAGRPPDILGMNHYLTSDRFLDHRPRRYPARFRGGNGRHRYADVEAVRMELPEGALGSGARLREMWERYRRPVAVTEVHHGCTREEQLRWLMESWQAASALRREGADVRGLTVWALFGVVDWNSLLTRRDDFYEPGAFDIRSAPPRPTVLAAATAALAGGREFRHPVLDRPGWWRRPERHYTPVMAAPPPAPARPLLITGAHGRLARVLAEFCAARGLPAIALPRAGLDITDAAAVRLLLERHRPWAVLNAAGHPPGTGDADACRRDNLDGAEILARACAAARTPLVLFSSAQVFGGSPFPCTEQDEPDPGNAFGRHKFMAERRALALHPRTLVIRAGHLVETGEAAVTPYAASPADALSHMPDLAQAVLDLLVDGEEGLWHLTHPGNAEMGDSHEIRLASRRGCLMPALRRPGQGQPTDTPQEALLATLY